MAPEPADEVGAYPRTRRLAQALAGIGLLGLIAVALAAIVDGGLRGFFNAPIDGVGEISKLVIAIVLVSFFPLALTERHNITIRFLGKAAGGRTASRLDGFGAVLTLGFFAVLAWRITAHAIDTHLGGETTWMLRWPVGPWWAVAALILVVCVPIQAVVLWSYLRGDRRSSRPQGGPG